MNRILQKNYVVAEIELSYKTTIKNSLLPKIEGSKDANQLLIESWDLSKIELLEQFKILLLNRANKAIGILNCSTGSATGTIADPRLIFISALKTNACGIILAHNHPSGNLKPSEADINLTKKLVQAGAFLDIKVMDHIIVTLEGFYSFADEGLI